jgi:hypothetical protein
MTALEFNAAIKTADQTLAAVEAAVLKNREDWRRPHLGASVIGGSCSAKLWYGFRWTRDPGFEARTLRLFARGQREEDSLAQLLRDAGLTVVQEDPQTGQQYSFKDGHFGGSMDGATHGLPESSQWHLLEFKTAGRKGFDKLSKEGVRKAQPTHWAQMQCYMRWSGMQRALYVSVCKDDDRLHLERIDYDAKAAEAYMQRAQDVIASDVPLERVSDDPSWYECKWCEHEGVCKGEKIPQPHCRTCSHVTFRRDGTTHCGLYDAEIPVGTQRTGCDRHLYNPAFLRNWARPIDASEADNWVQYQLTGHDVQIVNGQGVGRFSSMEMWAAGSPAMLADAWLRGTREAFDAEIVLPGEDAA